MPQHYAIELSLMLYHEGQWARTFCYYNHGEKPPFGGVRSEETTIPVVLSLPEFDDNVKAVEAWIRSVIVVVKSLKPVPREGLPDMPLEYNVESDAVEIKYRFSMESMEINVTYNKVDNAVTFDPRSAFDVSWRGFLFHQGTITDLLEEIKSQL